MMVRRPKERIIMKYKPHASYSEDRTLSCKFSGRQGGAGHLAIVGETALRVLC